MEEKKKTSKIIGIIIILISIAAIGGLIYASSVLNKQKEDINKHLVELTYKEFQKKLDNKDSFLLVVTRTDCSHCEAFKPKLKEILKDKDIIGYELATDKLSKDDANSFKKDYNISGTPTTIFIKKGEEPTVSNRLVGDVASSKIIERLDSLDYIK